MKHHHIFIEQLKSHIRTITLHIRQKDFVGVTFISNLWAYAILIGSANPLFRISLIMYNYRETNPTIYWLWRQNHWWKLNIQIELKTKDYNWNTKTNPIASLMMQSMIKLYKEIIWFFLLSMPVNFPWSHIPKKNVAIWG